MKTWKERLSLALALMMLVLCISACDPAAPGEEDGSSEASSASGESTGQTESGDPSNATETSEDSDTTGSAGATETTGATEAVDPTETTGATEAADPTETTGATQPPATQPPATKPTEPPETTAPPATQPPAAQGTVENPAVLAIGSNTASATGKGGYYYSWTADKDGTLELQMPSANWSYEVHNLTAGEGVTQISKSNDEFPANPALVSVLKGDRLQIIVNTANGIKGTVKFTAAFSTKKLGTEQEPFHVKAESVTGIRVPAGQTVHFSGRVQGTTLVIKNAGNAKLTYNKKEYTPSNGVIRVRMPEAEAGNAQALVFAITNSSGSIQVYTVEFEIPTGTFDNPEKLTAGTHTVSVLDNSIGYVYQWTATADGTLTIQMQGSNWYYQLYNLNSYKVEEGNSTDNSTNPVSIEVKAGQVVQITVNYGDVKAADISFTASFA